MNQMRFAGLLLLLISPAVRAEEYLIRVEGVGYEDVPASEKVPEEQSLYSAEVIAVPNQTFRSRTRLGPETLTLEGKLKPEGDGSFSLKIRFHHEVDTGMTVPTFDGAEEPVLNVTSTESSNIAIKLDRTVTFGGMESQMNETVDGKQTDVCSKLNHVVTVTRRQPEND